MVAYGMIPLGSALGGALIQLFGAITTVLLFAALMMGLAIATSFNSHVRSARSITGRVPA
jgi:predicted MFS family arabinose efflux permease